jgi:hypothetical protein
LKFEFTPIEFEWQVDVFKLQDPLVWKIYWLSTSEQFSVVDHFRDATKMGGYFQNGKNHYIVD